MWFSIFKVMKLLPEILEYYNTSKYYSYLWLQFQYFTFKYHCNFLPYFTKLDLSQLKHKFPLPNLSLNRRKINFIFFIFHFLLKLCTFFFKFFFFLLKGIKYKLDIFWHIFFIYFCLQRYQRQKFSLRNFVIKVIFLFSVKVEVFLENAAKLMFWTKCLSMIAQDRKKTAVQRQ